MSDRSQQMPRPRDGVMDIAAYVPGKSGAKGAGKVHKLSSNESPLGPSAKAREAYVSCAANLHLYPDGGATELRDALAQLHGINPANIVCGAGSDELLSLLAAGFLQPEVGGGPRLSEYAEVQGRRVEGFGDPPRTENKLFADRFLYGVVLPAQ